MAKKPPICISLPAPIIFTEKAVMIRILWFNEDEPPNAIAIDETQRCNQLPESPDQFFFSRPTPGPNQVANIQLTAPLDATYNAIIVAAKDAYGNLHYSETYFEPAQAPPFSQDIDLFSYDYPEPGTIRAEIRPATL